MDRKIDRAEVLQPVMLDDGHAEVMGDGMFILFQTFQGHTNSVTLSATDLAALLAAT